MSQHYFKLYNKQINMWVIFYPIVTVYPVEIFDLRKLEELPEQVYGKWCSGYVSGKPIWNYTAISKCNLVEEGKSFSTISSIW